MKTTLPESFQKKLDAVHGKRARTVIEFICEHGYITTEDLKNLGYEHAPRAARDVREQGIPLETFSVKDSSGKSIAAYKFGDPTKVEDKLSKVAGRTVLSKTLKNALIKKYGAKCFIYLQPMDERFLQVDHRIPYEIGGDQDENDIDQYMLLSPSANRAKSWTCENCYNWSEKDPEYCIGCFWAYPESYIHIAGQQQRQITITYSGDEVKDYDQLIQLFGREGMNDAIKSMIEKYAIFAQVDDEEGDDNEDHKDDNPF